MLTDCYNYDVLEPPMSEGAFHTSYIKIPYPFRTGDVVRIVTENERLGIVFGYKTQEEIDEAYERLKDIIDLVIISYQLKSITLMRKMIPLDGGMNIFLH